MHYAVGKNVLASFCLQFLLTMPKMFNVGKLSIIKNPNSQSAIPSRCSGVASVDVPWLDGYAGRYWGAGVRSLLPTRIRDPLQVWWRHCRWIHGELKIRRGTYCYWSMVIVTNQIVYKVQMHWRLRGISHLGPAKLVNCNQIVQWSLTVFCGEIFTSQYVKRVYRNLNRSIWVVHENPFVATSFFPFVEIQKYTRMRRQMYLISWLFRWFKFTLKPPNRITGEKLRLAIWDTFFWTFLVKFGHNGPWDI